MSYSANSADPIALSLYINGVADINETINDASAPVSVSKTVLIRVDSESTIGLFNSIDQEVSLFNAGLVVTRLE